ncbi:hypothetical protein PoB_000302300 [Plakobranchus ocellatus]|uniref:Uncharacterized protein n=1 Tax=Plakobranchus ocellatus TaxID=259542 RepID=A0AAV3Y1K9_9GAST|nr:hypothetical protein PoB_000302300 [Plakobranchus ocellatus]
MLSPSKDFMMCLSFQSQKLRGDLFYFHKNSHYASDSLASAKRNTMQNSIARTVLSRHAKLERCASRRRTSFENRNGEEFLLRYGR